jgi:DNA repair exonuclease SbcCD ATPase subunit
MKFKSVRWKNLFSYGKNWTKIDLDCNETINIIGSNGSGKSVLVEAIFFALTGKPFRKCKKDQIVNFTNKKNCLVELVIESGSNSFLIRRGAKPNVFEIEKNGSALDEDSHMTDVQTYLETVLGFNRKNLKHSLIMSTTDYIPFLRLPAGDKRAFIEDILSIEIFTIMNKLIKSKLSILKEEIRDNESEIEKLQYKLNMVLEYNKQQRESNDEEILRQQGLIQKERRNLSEDGIQCDNDIASAGQDHEKMLTECDEKVEIEKEALKRTLAKIKENAEVCREKMKTLKAVAADLEKDIARKNAEFKKIGDAKHEIYTEMMVHVERVSADREKYEANNSKGNQVRYNKSMKLSEQRDEIKRIENLPPKCNSCGQEIGDEFKEQEMAGYKAEIAELEASLEKIEGELEKVQAFKKKIDKYEADNVTPLDEKCKKLEKQMSDLQFSRMDDESGLRVNLEKQESLKREMKQLKAANIDEKKECDRRIKALQGRDKEIISEQYQKRIKEIEATRARLEKDALERIDQIEKRIEALKSEEFGNFKDEEGPRTDVEKAMLKKATLEFNQKVHDTAIKILSDKGIKTYIVKRYLPKLNSFLNQYLEILNAPYKMEFDEELNEHVGLKGYDRLGYNNFSEGERHRADIALLFAFLDIAKMKNSLTSNLLVMDEVLDKALDDDGIQGIINIMSSMKQKGFTIICLSPKGPVIGDRFDRTYRAIKEKFSNLEEV